jgi:myo-inositol-1(or 4)-monophosphatase
MKNKRRLLRQLLLAVKEAGEGVLKLQTHDLALSRKANNDIVTQADLMANDILNKHLAGVCSGYGWLSEETQDNRERLNKRYVWIVDPIDGTKEYVDAIPEYAISVALIERGSPLLAAVMNPATQELFYAMKDHGAYLGNKKISCKNEHAAHDKLVLLASRSEFHRGEWKKFEKLHIIRPVGSIAYKMALVAAGLADATFSLGPKNEWDIAAGALLVTEAGGSVCDKHQKAIQFNSGCVRVDGIIASCALAERRVFSLINEE